MRSFPLINPKAANTSDGTPEIDLFGTLQTLRRGKWLIIACVLGAVFLAGYYAFRVATPLYTATTTIALQSRNQQVVDLNSVVSGLGGDIFTINTEIEVLRARSLVEKLVDQLALVDEPLFNPLLAEEPSRSFSPVALVRDALVVTGFLEPREEGPPPTREQIREGIISAIQGSLVITNVEFSRAYHISISTPNAQTSANIVNKLAEIYILDQIAVKYEATEQANVWLLDRVAELRDDLENAENAVKTFRSSMALVGPEALAALDRQVKDFRTRVAAGEPRIEAIEARLASLEEARTSGEPVQMAAAAEDPALERVLPRLPEAREAFDARYEAILTRARADLEVARSQHETLGQSLAEIEAKLEAQSNDMLKLKQLEREAEASRQIYEYFHTRQKETSVQKGIHIADARVLSPAIVPGGPSSPRTTFILMAAAVLGTVLGSLIVLLREARQSGFRSPQDLEQAVNMAVLAQVPRAPVTKRRRVIRYLASKPASAMAEAIRNLRTSVMLSNVDRPPQVIMLTSSLPAEGKTTQSLALAQSFAAMGRRVLLIEGDIRRRSFREYFRVRSQQPGLIQAVMKDMPLEEFVYHSEELGVDVLIGEKSTINAADFFSSSRVRELVDRARAEYDIIIIDTPPVLIVPDARVIGGLADAVLYVVRWNRTTRNQLEEGLNSLANVDIKVSGLVLSQVDVRKAAYYGGRYSELYRAYGNKYYRN